MIGFEAVTTEGGFEEKIEARRAERRMIVEGARLTMGWLYMVLLNGSDADTWTRCCSLEWRMAQVFVKSVFGRSGGCIWNSVPEKRMKMSDLFHLPVQGG